MKQHFLDVDFEVSESCMKSPFFSAFYDAEKVRGGYENRVQIIADSEALIHQFFAYFGCYQFPFQRVYLTRVGTTADHLSSLIPILDEASKDDTITIVLSADKATIKACYDALQFADSYFSVALTQPDAGDGTAGVFMELRQPWLHRLSLLGTQAHRVDNEFMAQNEPLGLNSYRLGALRHDLSQVEPDIRSADLCGIDLNAMKHGDAPIQQKPSAVGLNTEEMCQITYYAGKAERNRVICMHGFQHETTQQSALGMDLLSSLVWYYLHGLENRSGAYPPDLRQLNTYVLEHKVGDMSLTFYKDESNQKWWLQAPFMKKKLTRTMPIIACDYRDYALAANEQLLSDRLQAILDLYEQSPDVEVGVS